jgi:hypothetical protein
MTQGVQELIAQRTTSKNQPPYLPSFHIMAPSTPPSSPKRHEFDTTKRARFFDAWDSKEKSDSVAYTCRKLDFNLPPSTARY